MKKLSIEDLKCGNILNYKDEEGEETYYSIKYNDIEFIGTDPKSFHCFYSPIVLTEFWAGELGFRPGNGQRFNKWIDEYENTSFFINVEDDKCHYVGISINQKDVWTTGRIKYVHEIQNIYHSITGIMLTSKLNFK